MALVSEFVSATSERKALHPTEVVCGWMAFATERGTVLQLETYGSDQRQVLGKVTQTLQLDSSAAKALLEILQSVFPTQVV